MPWRTCEETIHTAIARWLQAGKWSIPANDEKGLSMDGGWNFKQGGCLEIEETLRRLGGDKELLGQLYAAYAEDAPRKLLTLRQALEDEDLLQILKRAHSLKGASAAVGAIGCMQLAQSIEDAVHAEDMDTLHRQVPILEQELALVIDQIEQQA